MRVTVLHSDVGNDAPPDERDTIDAAEAVARALEERGHSVKLATFHVDPQIVRERIAGADAVFNMVEGVYGLGGLAPLAPAVLEQIGVPFTGCRAAAMALSGDKPATKHVLREARLPTPDWTEPPDWNGLDPRKQYVVKSATEDASLGLDDGAVVAGGLAVRTRAKQSAQNHGGRWFAEIYLEGREFNVSVVEDAGTPLVLPIPEMQFVRWSDERPRIVGYAAKWDEASVDSARTVHAFDWREGEVALERELRGLARKAWTLLGMRGFARVDFRLDENNTPMILEINPNPCIEPNAGFASAARKANMSYPEIVERILRAALS